MPVSITFNTTGAWGAGTGVLEAAEVDENFYSVKLAIEALEDDRPQPNNIASIIMAANGTQIIVILDDATEIGPLPLPVLQFRDRGEWIPFAVYAVLDVFSVEGYGLYSVRIAHTAAASFDEEAASTPVAATAIEAGKEYKIATVGTTDFTLIGAASNTVGVVFTATAAGTGSGTAAPLLYHKMIGKALTDGTIITETTTARTLALADAEKYIRTTNGADVTITIPPAADVAFTDGTTVAFEQTGAGSITVEAGAGVVLNCATTHQPISNGQFSVIQIKRVASDEWTIFGNLVSA